jgi:hypothetical protein
MTDHLAAKLHSTTDASIWAKEFCKLNPQVDEDLMLTWFANAIMTGYDEAQRRTREDQVRLCKLRIANLRAIESKLTRVALYKKRRGYDEPE